MRDRAAHLLATFTYDPYDSQDPEMPCSGAAETAVGNLTKMEDDSGTTYWCYDERGRVVLQRKRVDDQNYDIHSTYDSANRLVDLAYPDGEEVTHGYDPVHGQLESVSSSLGGSYLSNVQYDAALMPTSLPLGNGLTTSYDYDDRLRVESIVTPGAQNLAFAYDYVGNVETITDDAVPTTFEYDELNRLESATGAYEAVYEYNEIGNMTRKKEGETDYDLLYEDSNHVHAATLVRDHLTQAPVVDLIYDARGNLYVEGSTIYDYDMDNRLVAIRSADDADGDGRTGAEEAAGAPAPKPGSTCSEPQTCYSDEN